LLVAVQVPPEQPLGKPKTVTVRALLFAPATVWSPLSAHALHVLAAAACVTVTLLPFPNDTVPERGELLGFAVHWMVTLPDAPLPPTGDAVNQSPVDDVVQDPPTQLAGLPVTERV
jgi:hypothetical protein